MPVPRLLPWLISLLLVGVLVYLLLPKQPSVISSRQISSVLVYKMEAMGKLELVKYSVRDVLEVVKTNPILADDKILLVMSGEMVGCINLSSITEKDVVFEGDSLMVVHLPAPEICYAKLNHNESKVYDMSFTQLFDKTVLVDSAYKLAEQHLTTLAKKSDMLAQTQTNAKLLLKPLFESIAQRKVELVFDISPTVIDSKK